MAPQSKHGIKIRFNLAVEVTGDGVALSLTRPRRFLGCATRQTSLEEQLSALVVGHGNLLIACVKITSYN
jgi:hypothetical protein